MTGVALVLSGGGNRGALQAGALRVLLQAGVKPTLLVGTSVGAINAAFLASGATPERAGELVELWRGLSGEEVFPGSLPLRIWRLLRRRDYLYSPQGLRRLLELNLTYRLLEDATVKLVVVATNLATGLECRLDSGPVVDAVLASAAIPGMLPPVSWHGSLLIDGGVSANVPLAAAAAWGAGEAWVLDTGRPCEHSRPPRSAMDIAMQALSHATRARAQGELACPPAGVTVHYLPLNCAENRWFSDFSDTSALIKRGAELAETYLRARTEPLDRPS